MEFFAEYWPPILEFFRGTFAGIEKIFYLLMFGLAIEWLRPAEKNQPAKTIVFNAIYVVNFIVIGNIAMLYFGRVIGPTVEFLGGPLINLNLPDTWWAWLVHFGIFALVYDFGYYCFHRCQHSWRWFWCHHKFHHNDEHMNATTSFRHHWLENVYRIPFITIPMAFLFTIDSSMPLVMFDLLLVWAIFTHMNLKLDMGPLTLVFAGPQYHRIHHSNLLIHQDKNFGAYFPIWDVLLGTCYKPAKDEYPPCGTLKGETTWSLWEANVGVFKGWWDLYKNRASKKASEPMPIERKTE